MRLLLAAALAVLTGCAAAFAPPRPRWPALPDGHFMHVGDFLQVTGAGRAAKPARSETQARAEARDAAILDGWSRLRGYLDALPLEAGGTVGGRAAANPGLSDTLERLVYSAQAVSTRFEGPSAAVVLRLDKGAINRALGTEFR